MAFTRTGCDSLMLISAYKQSLSGPCSRLTLDAGLGLQVGSVPLSVMFGMCSLFLLLALWCQHNFLLLSVKSRIQSQLRKGLSASFVSRA